MQGPPYRACEPMKRDPRLERDYTLYYIPVATGHWLHTFIRNDQLARWNLAPATRASSQPEGLQAQAISAPIH